MGKNKNQKKSQQSQIQLQGAEQEPFLKGLQRKVRNLNKKLGTIQDLEKKSKADLNPQQVNKIEQKQDVLHEIRKYKDFIAIYEEVNQQNKDVIKESERKNRNNLLKQVATLLAVWKFGYVPEGEDKVNIEIIELLNHFSGEQTLEGMQQKISQALANYFDSQNEKKNTLSYKALNFKKVYKDSEQSKRSTQQQQQLKNLKQAKKQYEEKLQAEKAEKQVLAAQFHKNQTQMQSTIEASNKRDQEQQKKIQDLMETIKTLKVANTSRPKSPSTLKEAGKNKSIPKQATAVQNNAEENNTDVQSSSSGSKKNSPQMTKQTSEKPTKSETLAVKNTNTNATEAAKEDTLISQNVLPVTSDNVTPVAKQIPKTEKKGDVESKENPNSQPSNKNKKTKGKKHYRQKNEREEEKPKRQNQLVVSPRKSPEKPKVKYIRADKYAERLANEAKIAAAKKQAVEKEETAKKEAAEKQVAKKDRKSTDSKEDSKQEKGKKAEGQQAIKSEKQPEKKPHNKSKHYNKNYNNNHPKNYHNYDNRYRTNNYRGYNNYHKNEYWKNQNKSNYRYEESSDEEEICFTNQQVQDLKNDGFNFVGSPKVLKTEKVEAQPTKPNKKHYVEKKV